MTEEYSLNDRLQVRVDEVKVGDYCVGKVGDKEWLYMVTRPPVEQPVGVVTIYFEAEHRWTLPAKETLTVFRARDIQGERPVRETIEQLFEKMRAILRANGDWNVLLSVHDLYGTYGIAVVHLTKTHYQDRGMNLDKRIQNAIAFLESKGLKE